MKKIKIAILISGRGSNMQNLIEACKKTNFPAKISLVISNKANANGLTIAQENQIPTAVISHIKFANRKNFDFEMDKLISHHQCQLICLAGFMRILSSWFVEKWLDKLINIHPSFLPAFKGANAVEDALLAKADFTGCTVHFVRPEIDSGPIIKQEKVQIKSDDTIEILAKRILKKEHLIYPQALLKVCQKIQDEK